MTAATTSSTTVSILICKTSNRAPRVSKIQKVGMSARLRYLLWPTRTRVSSRHSQALAVTPPLWSKVVQAWEVALEAYSYPTHKTVPLSAIQTTLHQFSPVRVSCPKWTTPTSTSSTATSNPGKTPPTSTLLPRPRTPSRTKTLTQSFPPKRASRVRGRPLIAETTIVLMSSSRRLCWVGAAVRTLILGHLLKKPCHRWNKYRVSIIITLKTSMIKTLMITQVSRIPKIERESINCGTTFHVLFDTFSLWNWFIFQ